MWARPTPLFIGLEGKDGFSYQYSFSKGQFTTVTRVVAATEDGKPKVIVSYLLEALSSKEFQDERALEKQRCTGVDVPDEVACFGDSAAGGSLWMDHGAA